MLLSFTPRFIQKRWFFVVFIVLLVALIVESSLFVFFVLASGLGLQTFPSIGLSYHLKPSCSTLAPAVIATTSTNRTIEYSCPGQAALYMPLSCPWWGCGIADCCGTDVVLVKPEFSLPPGYLRLSLVDTYLGNCTSQFTMKLENGQNLTLGGGISNGGDRLNYDYCAIVAGPTGEVQGFTIRWYEVPWPGICCTITASPSQLTIPATANASSTSIITITAIGKFFGNVSISGTGEGPGYTGIGGKGTVDSGWTWRFNPSTVTLKPGGSNTTTVTIILVNNPAPQTFILVVYTYPNRHYTGLTWSITVKVT